MASDMNIKGTSAAGQKGLRSRGWSGRCVVALGSVELQVDGKYFYEKHLFSRFDCGCIYDYNKTCSFRFMYRFSRKLNLVKFFHDSTEILIMI